MTTQPPSPEAVEAAMKWATNDAGLEQKHYEVLSELQQRKEELEETVARILAAEVERLRVEIKELMETLDWLEEEAPFIVDDAWTNSVDMSGNRWTLRTRINGPTQKFRGRTLIETIQRARYAAVLAKKEGER